MTDTTPIERLRAHSLADEEARSIANYQQPGGSGLHASAVVPVIDTGDGIRVGDPTTTDGGTHVRWSDSVIMTFGAAPKSVAGVRRSYQDAKHRTIEDTQQGHL
jgi:hypothetical protein